MRPSFCLFKKWICSYSLCIHRKLCCSRKKYCLVFLVGFPAWISISTEALVLKTCFYSSITTVGIIAVSYSFGYENNIYRLFIPFNWPFTYLPLFPHGDSARYLPPLYFFLSSPTLRDQGPSKYTPPLLSWLPGIQWHGFYTVEMSILSPTHICGYSYLSLSRTFLKSSFPYLGSASQETPFFALRQTF